ncbi:penicillin-binding protein 2 [Candidatus Parcubacteria bacterium]|nr:penicillin-binding protein 2 [Candidatus Parcubacteria bacterium]
MSKPKSLFGYAADGALMPQRRGPALKRRLQQHEQWAEAVLPADATASTLESDTNRRPLVGLVLVALAAFLILTGRLFMLQVVHGERNMGLADGNRIRQKVTRAPRGILYDRSGKVLVRNEASFDVTVVAAQLSKTPADRQAVYRRLGGLIGLPAAEVAAKAEAEGLSHAQPQLVASGIERERALALDPALHELPGFYLDTNPVRRYSDPRLSHLLGYTGRVTAEELKEHSGYSPVDYIGKVGLEKRYEPVLRGSNGSEQTEVDATGRPVKVLAARPAQPGASLVLAIDQDLETKLSEAIGKQMERAGSKKAAGVALDPKSGEVLAAVSLPGYDNNLFSGGISQADYAKLANNPAQPLFNKSVSGAYPTGSIIKPLVAAAALAEGVVTAATTINDTGQLELTNRYDTKVKYIFRNHESAAGGTISLKRALAISSNVFFYTLGGGFGQIAGLGADRLGDYYHRFGLGQPTGIDLAGEAKGHVPSPDWKQKVKKETWFTGDTYNMAVGQGDTLASPLQMAVATAAVANGGTVYRPRLVRSVTDDEGKVTKQIEPQALRQNIIPPAHLATVREAMRQVVASPGGTACCRIEEEVPVAVAGKTGTAQAGDDKKPHAWFSAFAPYDDPKIVLVVLVENSGEGAEFAAPAVRETLSWYFRR